MEKKKIKKAKIKKEFEGASFGDKRLDKRLLDAASILNAQPTYCINAATDDWTAKKATYRFFSNEKISSEKILEPHFAQTKKRMQGWDFVYSIEDTSFLEFNKHKKTEGLGSIGRYGDMDNHIQGLVAHLSLAVSNTGLPLGLQSFEVWARPEEGYGNTSNGEREKESQKWIRHMAQAKSLYSDNMKMVYLADRESDIFEVFDGLIKLKADGVVRSKHDRYVKGRDLWLTRALEKTAPCGQIILDEVKKNDKKRNALLSIKFTEVSLEVPGNNQRRYPFGLKLNVVDACETNPPKDTEPLHWRLLTTLEVNNAEDAKQIVQHYKMRWNIESYFKILKSGCKVEDCRLEKAERIIRYASVMSVIAWRIFWSVHVNRLAPNSPWSFVLTQLEFHTLWVKMNKKEIMEGILPKKPPSDQQWPTRQCIRAVARLGGFNGRKCDGEPGMMSIWRGWTRLQDMTEVAEALF